MNHEEFKKRYSEKTYLGDGLYVHFDGYNFVLSAERENGEHWVGLELSVFDQLILYRIAVYDDVANIKEGIDEPI